MKAVGWENRAINQQKGQKDLQFLAFFVLLFVGFGEGMTGSHPVAGGACM